MANLDNITIRYYNNSETQFNYLRANEPIQDVFRMVKLVNEELVDVTNEVKAARGDKDKVGERLDVSLNPDGTIKANAISDLPTSSVKEDSSAPYNGADKIFFTRAEKAKLKGVAERSNRFLMRVNKSEPVEGLVTITTGDLIRLSQITTSDGETRIVIDTTFSPDELHVHRYGIVCNSYSNGIALLPEDDNPISGSVRVYVNGVRLRRSAYVEYYQGSKVVGVQVKESPGDYDLSVDDIEFDYDVRVSRITRRPAREEKRLLLDHDLVAEDKISIYLPEDSGNQTPFHYWLIDISDVEEDLTEAQLFVTAIVNSNKIGGTLRRYGQDWDIVTIGGARYIRWRYQANTQLSTDSNIEDRYANYLFLTQSGSGTPEDPETRTAEGDLAVGMKVILFR